MSLSLSSHSAFENAPEKIVIFVHGYGANGEDLLSLSRSFAKHLPPTVFLAPNAPFSCPYLHSGFQWFEISDRSHKQMQQDVVEAAKTLDEFIDTQLQNYNLKDEDLCVIGFSQGTMVALQTMYHRPKCAGIIGYSGALLNHEDLENNLKSTPPTLLVHGEKDMVVPSHSSLSAEMALSSLGVPTEMHLLPGIEHTISPEGVLLGHRFLQEVFK